MNDNATFMPRWKKVALVCLALLVVVAAGLNWYIRTYDEREPSRVAFADHCADCHGQALEGTHLGPALTGRELVHGDSISICDSLFLFLRPQRQLESTKESSLQIDLAAAAEEADRTLQVCSHFKNLRRRKP